MSFITILTRVHPNRPRCLARNIASVKAQKDQDLQHLLLRPEIEPHDVIKVGPLIHEAAPLIDGRYIMQLPDDDVLCANTFVTDLKAITEDETVEMIIMRCTLGEYVYPTESYWQTHTLALAHIAGQNGILSRRLYDEASHEWLLPLYEADFYYLQTAFRVSKKTIWWDYIGIESQSITGNNMGRSEDDILIKPYLMEVSDASNPT